MELPADPQSQYCKSKYLVFYSGSRNSPRFGSGSITLLTTVTVTCRILKVMVRQEATRKLGFTITPEEEQLRFKVYNT